jgi:uncharacterized protein YutD
MAGTPLSREDMMFISKTIIDVVFWKWNLDRLELKLFFHYDNKSIAVKEHFSSSRPKLREYPPENGKTKYIA